MLKNFKGFIFDLLFPKFCLSCQREGNYLCEDCQSTLGVLNTHQKHQTHSPAGGLKDLYFAIDYQQPLIKNLIKLFKYQPFVKELGKPLTSLIITHFQLIEKSTADFVNFILVPVPLERKKLKWRGFNQAEEIGKELAKFFGISLLNNVLAKIKETPAQVELSEEERKENIRNAFSIKNGGQILGKKILLVDDVYTTGATMEECARVLKKAGAKEVIGIVIARAAPGQDQSKNV